MQEIFYDSATGNPEKNRFFIIDKTVTDADRTEFYSQLENQKLKKGKVKKV